MYKVLIIIAIIVVVVGSGWWFLTAQPGQQNKTTSSSSQSSSTDKSGGITIVFTDDGFEQQNYTVGAGQTVTVKNESSLEVQFSSDEHPTHTDNPELNMDILTLGEQGSFIPERTGDWGIHDHEHPEFITTLIVTN